MLNFIRIYSGLVRLPNLVIVAATMLLVRWYMIRFLDMFDMAPGVDDAQFIGILIAMLSVTAAGYVINDLLDGMADVFNKPHKTWVGPHVSFRLAWWIYGGLNLLGLVSIIWVALQRNAWWMIPAYLAAWGLLFVYSRWLKCTPLLGNLLVALFCGAVVFCLPVADIYVLKHIPDLGRENFWMFISIYAYFSFMSNLVREIIKDIEDAAGDHRAGCKTTAIALGEKTSAYMAMAGCVLSLPAAFLMLGASEFAYFLILPAFSSLYMIYSAIGRKGYGRASLAVKLWMVCGLLFLLFYVWFRG